MPALQVFIISWKGKHDNACAIARALEGADVCIVWSDPDPQRELPTAARTIRRPDHLFFGDKFQACLDAFDASRMLVIHADCQCADWAGLVKRCDAAMTADPRIAVWAPLIRYTGFGIERTHIADLGDSGLAAVAHTDTIVFALDRPVVERLRRASLADNTFGWGVGWLAAAFSYTTRRIVAVDRRVAVSHPRSRGYDTQEASAQRERYLRQLTAEEGVQCRLLGSHMALHDLLRKRRAAQGPSL